MCVSGGKKCLFFGRFLAQLFEIGFVFRNSPYFDIKVVILKSINSKKQTFFVVYRLERAKSPYKIILGHNFTTFILSFSYLEFETAAKLIDPGELKNLV